MTDTSPAVRRLVARLEALGDRPALLDVADALRAAALTPEDLSGLIRPDPRRYSRVRVALTDAFEMLVMTWLPGQCSVPHDHAGSLCAMAVVQGEAAEVTYRQSPDGLVDAVVVEQIEPGRVVAGDDAAIHSVHNPSATHTLVTVHIYAPPLKDFRRYTPRSPEVAIDQLRVAAPAHPGDRVPTICVIGGGFCGTMTAAHLLRSATGTPGPVRVVLMERRGSVGEGVAYGTTDTAHLLNVPAGRMSAWPDQPDDLVTFAHSRDPGVRPTDYLPRTLYAEYLRSRLRQAADACPPERAVLSVSLDEARRVSASPGGAGGWIVHAARGPTIAADAVVLAVGHRPPTDPFSPGPRAPQWLGSRLRWIADPWRPFAVHDVEPDEPVLVIGAGLTAVDIVLSLFAPAGGVRRKAPVTLVSRRGLLAQAHAAMPVSPARLDHLLAPMLHGHEPVTARALSRVVRRAVREAAGAGGDWRSVIDALRPHTPALWRGAPRAERERFLARLRPIWEVHRHRMAPAAAARIAELQAQGLLRVVAARIDSAHGDERGVTLNVRPSASPEQVLPLRAAWAVNCTGPSPTNRADANPVIGSLLVGGAISVDELGLGLRTGPGGRAIDAAGRVRDDLLVVGTLRKPDTWESTAVPELRVQAADAARAALEVIAARSLSPTVVRRATSGAFSPAGS